LTDVSEVLTASNKSVIMKTVSALETSARALMMETVSASETSVNFYDTTQRNFLEISQLIFVQ
jgi:hypothetical protein